MILKNRTEINKFQSGFNKLIGLYFKTNNKVFAGILEDRVKKMNLINNPDYFNPEKVLVDLYKILREKVENNDQNKKQVQLNEFIFSNFKDQGQEYKVINNLSKVFKKYPEIVKSSILHGSFATKDFSRDFSDLDLQIILNDDVFSHPDKLKFAKKILFRHSLLCYRVDILTHHEFMFLTEFDLENYSQGLLPLEVYEESLILSGEKIIGFSVKKTPEIISEKLKRTLGLFLDHKIAFNKYSVSPFDYKNALANLIIIPSLVLGYLENSVYKRDSFSKIIELYPEFNREAIEIASQERKNWKQFNILKAIPLFCFKFLPINFIRILIRINKKFLKTIFIFKNKSKMKDFFVSAEVFSKQIYNKFFYNNEIL